MHPYTEITDEQLVEKVRRADQELYREVVGRYQEKLLRYANYLCRDEAMAADVVQQAFIKAFINLNGFDIKKSSRAGYIGLFTMKRWIV